MAATYVRQRLPRRRRSPRAAARRALHAVWTIGCLGMLLVAAGLTVAALAFHLTPLSVTSGSMEPAVPVHSLILVEQVPADAVRVGDIVTFDPPGPTGRVTHRVVARE